MAARRAAECSLSRRPTATHHAGTPGSVVLQFSRKGRRTLSVPNRVAHDRVVRHEPDPRRKEQEHVQDISQR
jgi:hypothetical protein